MYKTSIECYKDSIKRTINYSYYQGVSDTQNKIHIPETKKQVYVENKKHQIESYEPANIKWTTSRYTNMSDPNVWGPAFWFTLHNGASKYPISASPLIKERMKSFILGIPIMLPCYVCKVHATEHIENNKHKLEEICSGRDNLVKFFVDFHNIVNVKNNKPTLSVEEVNKIYNGGVNVNVMSLSNI